MKISNLEFLKLLPQFMQEDESVQALASAMDKLLRNDRIDTLRTWDKFSELTDKECDELAWEFDVDWYDSTLSLSEKQKSLKSALQIKQKRGTVQSINQLINSYLEKGKVIESEQPFCFSIEINNPDVSKDNYNKFLNALKINKNAHSILVDTSYVLDLNSTELFESSILTYQYSIPQCGAYYCGQEE